MRGGRYACSSFSLSTFYVSPDSFTNVLFPPSWDVFAEGVPHIMKAESPLSLPCEVRFSFTKNTEFLFTATVG